MTQDEAVTILKTAVQNEIEAYEFYRDAAEMTADAALKAVFANLAKDELKHKVLLEGCVSGARPLAFQEVQDYQVSETVESPVLSTGMRFVDAIALAMKKEEEAMKMYAALARSSSDPEQQNMFTELANMEAGHKAGLEDIFVNAAFVEAW